HVYFWLVRSDSVEDVGRGWLSSDNMGKQPGTTMRKAQTTPSISRKKHLW
ncbi:hypothetical protein COCCADRAFT_82583, partial [Bipolaris zeicola 26-R-13]